ncbi:MAG TPA: hypothetical protein V6C52_11065 [Coleofasciculaceae cyanobacterium]
MSQAVRLLEKAPYPQQQTIATIIVGSMQLHHLTQRSEHGLKKLGSEKVMGLMKSKGKRRWYDQDPLMHQAFNYLYLMDDVLRHEMAVKVLITLNALEESTRKEVPEKDQFSLAKAIFEKPLLHLLEKTEFVLQFPGGPDLPISMKMQSAPQQALEINSSSHEPINETPAAEAETEGSGASPFGGINTTGDGGMKIVRLRKSST